MGEWYSVAELAEETGISEATLRRYLNSFKPYFVSKGGNRAKKYDSSAIELLKRIRQLYEAGYEKSGITEVISIEFPMILTDEAMVKTMEKPNVATLATSEDMVELKRTLAEMNEKLARQEEFNSLLIQRLTDQERFIKESLESRDQLLLERLTEKKEEKEETTIPAEEETKGFWKKLFK